jgi:F0F1-type ATP synthase assembly protein I
VTPDISSPAPQQPKPPSSLFLSLRLAWNLGFIIALPVVIFGFGGAYLDKYLKTSPLFVLIGFVLAVLISGIGVYRKVKEIGLSK